MRATFGVLAVLLVSYALLWPISPALAEEVFDAEIRAAMLKRKDGLITRIETVYNDIFVAKTKNLLTMSFHWKGYYFQESQVNLADPDDLPMLYARTMSIATIYPQDVKRVLISVWAPVGSRPILAVFFRMRRSTASSSTPA